MKSPTEILSAEHQNILKIIDALLKECNILESEKEIDKAFFEKAIDFIRNYADKFHHAKEEDILFKEMLENESAMHCDSIEQMLYEHDQGRNFVKGFKQGLEENDKNKIIENVKGYAYLLRDHINKEDSILYPMANEVLNQEVQESILEKFKQVEAKRFSKGTKEKYLSIVKEFENK